MAGGFDVRARKPSLRSMSLAVILGAAAFLTQWVAQPLFGGRIPFLFFLPAIAFAGAYGGFWPAVLVTLIGASTGIYTIRQGGPLMLETSPAAWAALAFIIFASGLLFFGLKLHAASRRAAAAELRLRTAEEDAAVGLFEIDVAQDSLFASSGFWQLLGREPLTGAVPLSAWLRGLPPEEVARARELLLQPRSRLRAEFEHRVGLQGGESRWVMTRFRAQGPTDGAPDANELGNLLIRGVMVDITERKEAERALAAAQTELEQQVADLNELHELSGRLESTEDLAAQLQQILATVARIHGAEQGLVSLISPDGTRLRLVAQQGFSPAACRRLSDLPLSGGACGTACVDRQRVVIDDVETDERFAPYKDFAREEGFRTVHATPLLDHDGERLGAITVHLRQPRAITERERRLTDICARKAVVFIERMRAEALAHEHDRRFRSVLDASAAGFAVLRPVRDDAGLIHDFHWIYLNPAAAAALERTPEQLIGRNVLDVMPGAWDQGELFDAYVSVARDRQLRELEHQTRHTARSEWFHVIASPLDGDVAVWFTNVTARRRNEQALLEADQRKDEFLATLAHELRNPLAPIRQATQIAMTARASDAQKRWSYAVIERQVQHMSLLLDDLLDISRITRGRLQLRRQNCKLREVFSAAVEAARPLIDKKEHEFALDLPAEDIWVNADPLRLSQILSNLLTNAAKYTNAGGRLRAAAREEGGTLVIEVEDNGIGLDTTELAAVFNMFSQVTAAQERSEGGLGIGLALTRGLVQLHGGEIEARSAGLGKGATFIVRLPIICQPLMATKIAMERTSVMHAGTRRRRLIIADDNRDAAESLAMLMRLEGHEVRLAHDGRAALAALMDFRPDAALLDIGMPGLTGYDLAREIRADPTLNSMLLIAITGWGQADDKARALAEGFDVHMTKPIEVIRVIELLQEPARRA